MRKLALAAIVVLAALAGSLGPVSSAHALNGGPWPWHNTALGVCLDSNPAGVVYTLGCNAGPFQLWVHSENRFGDQIRNFGTNRCLDSNSNNDVYTLPCNGGNYQRWVVTHKGAFGWEISNVATGFCLDTNSDGIVYAISCNGGNFQRWY